MPSNFDNFLKRITYEETKASRFVGQVLAIVDPKSGQVVLGKIPFLWIIRQYGLRYYLVTPHQRVDCPKNAVTITDFSGRRRIIEFSLSVYGAEPEELPCMVSTLSKAPTPFDGLVANVTHWL